MEARKGSRIEKLGCLAVGLVLLSAISPSTALGAFAGVFNYNGKEVARYVGDPGEKNHVTATVSGGVVTFSDPGIVIQPRAGCESSSRGIATCRNAAGIDSMQIDTGDKVDSITNNSNMKANLVSGLGSENDNETINGGGGPDYAYGGGGNDIINGNGGNDELHGSGENDSLSGGAGDDLVIGDDKGGGSGSNVLSGGAGGDTLIGSQNLLTGFGQTISGGSGQDYIYGASGPDALAGDDGADLLDPGEDNAPDIVHGGADKDVVDYLSNNPGWGVTVSLDDVANDGPTQLTKNDNIHSDIETVWGGPKNDVITGTGGPQSLWGFGGDDLIDGGGGSDDIHGGAGYDRASYSTRNIPVNASLDGVANDGVVGEHDMIDTDVEGLIGGSANDTLTGNDDSNLFAGGPGSDTLTGYGGFDNLSGNAGDDTLSGGAGPDYLDFEGGAGDDKLDGGGGDDLFQQGYTPDGSDVMDGGPGIDTVRYDIRLNGGVTVTLDGVADDGQGAEGDNVTSTVENVVGSDGPDTITGSPDDNTLAGGDGKDTIRGFAGDDEIAGGDGADSLFGGAGADILHAIDGFPDSLSCGTEIDKYGADGMDTVGADCEQALP